MNTPLVDILLVDDNPTKALALQTALAALGQRLVVARSGREALRHMLEQDFATVILDVHMPDMDGFETAQFIRSRPRSAHTPIIFVSAINLAETDALRGYALGAVDYIFAPVIPEVLRAKVAVFVELYRKTEEAKAHAAKVLQQKEELEASQQRLRLVERMAALGTFAAGLGHDMGNLLLPVRARLDVLSTYEFPPDVREDLDAIGKCAAYLQNLARGLRSLSKDPQEGQLGATDLHAWLGTAMPFLRHAVHAGISLRSDVPAGLPLAPLAEHCLTQAVLNMVNNASDAIGPATHNGEIVVAARQDGEWLLLSVSDNGQGMSDDVKARCIEPFFTTKPFTISTGLGLAIVHSLAAKAGGRVEIVSARGQGATISMIMKGKERAQPGARPSGAVQDAIPLVEARAAVVPTPTGIIGSGLPQGASLAAAAGGVGG
jgi:signal transduction histidine kinase